MCSRDPLKLLDCPTMRRRLLSWARGSGGGGSYDLGAVEEQAVFSYEAQSTAFRGRISVR